MKGKVRYVPVSLLGEIDIVKKRYNLSGKCADSAAMDVIAQHNRIALEIEEVSKTIVPSFLQIKGNKINGNKVKRKSSWPL